MRRLLSLNAFMKSRKMIYFVLTSGIVSYGLFRWLKTERGYRWKSKFLHKVPLISTIMNQTFSIYFFNALSLLTNNGIPIAHSLKLIDQTISDPLYKHMSIDLVNAVHNGMSLSLALSDYPQFFLVDDCALIKTGEESGLVGKMAQLIAQKHIEALEYYTNQLTLYLQPFCILVLGALVGIIIAQVYGPIMNISMKI